MSSKLLLTICTTNIPEEYLEILGNDIIHHRTPEFRRIMKENNENLKKSSKQQTMWLFLLHLEQAQWKLPL